VRSCPFGAPGIDDALIGIGAIDGAARIIPALCQGCGVCAAACPAGAIELLHYTNEQMMAKIDALFDKDGAEMAAHTEHQHEH
jgi:heterodisulfide reductase subunit A